MSATKRKVNEELDALEVAQAQPTEAPALAGNVVTLYEHQPASPLDLPAEVFRAGLARRKENRAALMGWIREALVEGTDFGRIQTKRGPSKPSLWKPGAEKICGMLGVTVHYPNLSAYEQAALAGSTLAAIILRCELHDSQGRTVAEGIGARSLQQDGGDLNKALKMAGKSAHIDAALRMAGLSEVFTQDIEDVKPVKEAQPVEVSREQEEPVAPAKITSTMHKLLETQIREFDLERARVKAWISKAWGVEHFPDLNLRQFEKLVSKLEQWAAEEYAKAEAASAQNDPACPF